MSKLKIITPKSMIIEKTAGEMAGVFFDACRSSNMTRITLRGEIINLLKFKNNPKLFARKHLEKLIPDAVKHLTSLLSHPNMSTDQKDIILEAILERTNDDQVNAMGKMAGLPEFEKTVLYKPDDEKPKPIIVKDIKNGENKV